MIRLFDGARVNARYRDELRGAMSRVLDSGRYIMGEEVEAFEAELAHYLGCEHVIGMSSGTDALLCALMASGIGPGDRVVTTPYTFSATAAAIVRVGAEPVFADIDAETLCLDPERVSEVPADVAIPVHLFGMRATAPPGVRVIEDSAQRITEPRGNAVCLSFFPTKPLGGLGDGGAIATNDPQLAASVRRYQSGGTGVPGGNFRLDAIQAAVLRVKLRHIDADLQARRDIAHAYTERLDDLEWLRLPADREQWSQYVVRCEHRDELHAHLAAMGIESRIYYGTPLHWRPPYRQSRQCPIAEHVAREALALPIWPGMSLGQVEQVVDGIRSFRAPGPDTDGGLVSFVCPGPKPRAVSLVRWGLLRRTGPAPGRAGRRPGGWWPSRPRCSPGFPRCRG